MTTAILIVIGVVIAIVFYVIGFFCGDSQYPPYPLIPMELPRSRSWYEEMEITTLKNRVSTLESQHTWAITELRHCRLNHCGTCHCYKFPHENTCEKSIKEQKLVGLFKEAYVPMDKLKKELGIK